LGWEKEKEKGHGRGTLKVYPRFSLMLPYLTVSSVVGVKSGTESGIAFAAANLDRISDARVLERKVVGHEDWRSCTRGDAYADAIKRSES
jgi:hypothetical protein